MKRKSLISAILGTFMLMALVYSCVDDDAFDLPVITIPDPAITPNTTFEAVISRYEQAVAEGEQIAVFDDGQDLYISGYVISSDCASNFFEELIIQNHMDDSDPSGDPRRGLKIEINVRALSDTYEVGRKVYVRLNGLAVGEANGVITLGKPEGSTVGQIQEFEYLDVVIRDPEVVAVVPKVVTVDELSENDENTLIQLNNVQVNRNQLSMTFAGEPSDEFDGFRTLESCLSSAAIMLQTSTFADFKSLQLPQKSGSITGILSRDFFDDRNVFIINGVADIDMTAERCDPEFLDCSSLGNGGSTVWEEDFENFDGFQAEGWTNVNVSGGSTDWSVGSFSSNTYAQISGFNANENQIHVWLVSPAINLDGSSNEILSFDVQTSFNNGNILSVFISNDFNGDVTTAEWQLLDVTIPEGSSSGFGNFENVGPINISCLDGNVHVAFVYEGADPGPTTRYHLDNVKVKGD